jgi:hypothetical protein
MVVFKSTGYDKNTIEEHDPRQTLVRNIDQVFYYIYQVTVAFLRNLNPAVE